MLYFFANRKADWEYDFRNSEIYQLQLSDNSITPLTERDGPDRNPIVSPDGEYIAYLGFTDKREAYQNLQLHLMRRDGSEKKVLSSTIDASLSNIQWAANGKGLYFNYDEKGNGKIGYINLKGEWTKIANNRGGTTLGRPMEAVCLACPPQGRLPIPIHVPTTPLTSPS